MKKILPKIGRFFKKKKVIWTIIILVVIFAIWFLAFRPKNPLNLAQTQTVARQNIEQTVLATGQVVSGTDLNLSFQGGGIVRQVLVKEGDTVRAGQTLASLDQSTARATLTSAEGSLAQAKANYDKLLAGASGQDINVSKAAVKASQVAVDNAKQSLITKSSSAYNNSYNIVVNTTSSMFQSPSGTSPELIISGVSFNNQELYLKINKERADLNILLPKWRAEISQTGLSSDFEKFATNTSGYLQSMSAYVNDLLNLLGSYSIVNSSTAQTTLDTYKATVSTALTTVNASVLDVNTASQTLLAAETSLLQSQAALDLKAAPPTQAEIDAASAQILSSQGQVDSARAALNNLILFAPTSGTITQIDVKVGEQAVAMTKVMVLQNIEDLHAEADVSEANIAALAVGQSIDYTFDALGPDDHFLGKILTIDPASTVVSGVVNYKVKGSFENVTGIKPGMTANMTIMTNQKADVIAVPSTAVITKNNNKYVRVIDNPETNSYREVQVRTGIQADGGLIEIISGLNEGETIITFMK